MNKLSFCCVLASTIALGACSAASGVTPTAAAPAALTSAVAKMGNIEYTGPECKAGLKGCKKSHPEVDLYGTTPKQAGYSRSFTVTQSGWHKAFHEQYAKISGEANNCPSTKTAAYLVTSSADKTATKYTVKALTTAKAGECQMTLVGGDSKKLEVTLTFTSTGIGIH